jgi:hypothetical protein
MAAIQANNEELNKNPPKAAEAEDDSFMLELDDEEE